MRLDSVDLAILRILHRDGRITKAALAEQVGLSPTPTWQRLKKLEDAGVIDGYRAELNLRKLGAHVTVFVAAELTGHTAAHFRTFENAIKKQDEITACWALGGGFDYLFQVVTRDIESYQDLIDSLLNANIGLARYYTYVVTKPIKGSGMPPFDLLASIQNK